MRAFDPELLEASGRDAKQLYAQALAAMPPGDLWVFGYGSLIWNPEVAHDARRAARAWGWQRGLCMWSHVNRGTVQRPGLVFALVPGGSFQGIVPRVPRARAEAELQRLWQREMPSPVYDPRWLRCRTPGGDVRALAFTLSRASPSHAGRLDADALLPILRDSRGRYGSTLEYVLRTAQALRAEGIRDRALERIVQLAEAAGLR